MKVSVTAKPSARLTDTPLVHQTSFWSSVKRRLGWRPLSFDISVDGQAAGDVLILTRRSGARTLAYAPFGPETLPHADRRGEFLHALSETLRPLLGADCAFVRWDLPWTSPYADDDGRYDGDGRWLGPPEPRLRELRMNWGVPSAGVRKAPSDILPPDTMIVDLRGGEDALLRRMKPKTRYNIRLSRRKGVRVRTGGPEDLPLWQRLYGETAARNHFVPHAEKHFRALFGPDAGSGGIQLLIAELNGKALAAMFLSVSADRATYLYGASSGTERGAMAPYALQWEAMLAALGRNCLSYDLFGVAPRPDPEHPLYGLYAFKSGFGGRLLHRQGAWDYPYDQAAYTAYLAAETAAGGYHLR